MKRGRVLQVAECKCSYYVKHPDRFEKEDVSNNK